MDQDNRLKPSMYIADMNISLALFVPLPVSSSVEWGKNGTFVFLDYGNYSKIQRWSKSVNKKSEIKY